VNYTHIREKVLSGEIDTPLKDLFIDHDNAFNAAKVQRAEMIKAIAELENQMVIESNICNGILISIEALNA
jgi:hypothetical protein